MIKVACLIGKEAGDFYVFAMQTVRFPAQKHTVYARKTYVSASGNIKGEKRIANNLLCLFTSLYQESGLFYVPYEFGRHTSHYGIGRHVFRYDGSGCNDGVVTNGNSLQNGAVRATHTRFPSTMGAGVMAARFSGFMS